MHTRGAAWRRRAEQADGRHSRMDLLHRIAELEAIVADQARRIEAGAALLRYGSLRILRLDRRIEVDRIELDLLPREYELLLSLALAHGTVVPRAELERRVWKRVLDGGSNATAVHVSRLRSKLAGTGIGIETVRGAGYRLVSAVAVGSS